MPRLPHPLGALFLLAAGLLPGCAAGPESNQLFERGLREAEGGDVQAAIKTLSAGVEEYPGHVRMRFELARLQYEVGESYHLKERQAYRSAAAFQEQGKREDGLANQRKANEHRARATPYYQAARDNLELVCSDETDDHRIAWAYYILMRCDVFFEDWEAGYRDLQRAIELGKPTGPLLSQWREYQSALKDKMARQVRY